MTFIFSLTTGVNGIISENRVIQNELDMNTTNTEVNIQNNLNNIDPEINYENIIKDTLTEEKNINFQMQNYNKFLNEFIDDNNESNQNIVNKPKTNAYLKTNSYNDWYSRPVINIDFDKVLYQPEETVNFIIQATQNLEPFANQIIEVKIYNGENNFYYSVYGYFEGKNDIQPANTQTYVTNSEGFVSASFIPSLPGRYVVTAKFLNSGYVDYYHVLTVSDLGIFLRMPYYYIPGQDVSGYLMVVDGSNNFNPIESADVNIELITYSWSNEGLEAHSGGELNLNTDENGFTEFSLTTSQNNDYWGELILTASHSGKNSTVRRSIWSSWYYQSQNSVEYVPTFDKPIYQPGEMIKGRVLVWENSYLNATKVPLKFKPITVKLMTPSLITITQRIIPTDENGIIDFEFPLDEDANSGSYRISFETSEFDRQSVEIPVRFYEKPAFKISISTEKSFANPGSNIKGKVLADYYFGKPVTAGNVKVEIIDPSTQTVVSSSSGMTDLNGEYSFSLKIPNSLKETDQVTISASVEDPVGRSVSNSITIATVSDIYVWGWVSPWLPKPDDSIKVNFYSYQASSDNRYGWYWWWRPLPLEDATGKVTVYGRNEGIFGLDSRTKILEKITTTDSSGRGTVEFELPLDTILKYDNFIIEIEVSDDDGRKASTDFSFSYAIVYLEIIPKQDSYLQGEDITLDLNLKKLDGSNASGNVTIVLNDADYDTVAKGSIEIIDGKGELSIPTSDLAPDGYYFGYGFIRYIDESSGYYSWYYYYSEYFVVKMGESSLSKIYVNNLPKTINAGDSIEFDISIQGDTNNPIIIELVKRGITSVYVESQSSAFSFNLENTEFLAPKVTIFIFTILSSGVILEYYASVEILQEFNAEISTDKDVYEPGDTAKVSIKLTGANDKPLDAMTALSFVDGSIYGVVEDPLWEEEFFSSDQKYWPSITTVTNWNGFQPNWWYPWYWALDDAVSVRYYGYVDVLFGAENEIAFDTAAPTKSRSDIPSEPSKEIDIRDNLPESMYWIPRLYIPATGWEQEIVLPDNIGEWVVRLTVTKGGSGAVIKSSFNTQLPFFVEISKPAILMQDDIVGIKGVFYNYHDELVRANVTIFVDGVEILAKNEQNVVIPSNFLTQVTWAVYAKEPGTHNVTITAVGTGVITGNIYTDGIQKTIRIEPNGVLRSQKLGGELLNGTLQLNITQYAETIYQKSSLTIAPGLQNLALSSYERLVGYPYGCVEQTMSRVLPTTLVYQYLLERGELDEDTEKELNNMITSGLSRLYSFRHYDGGFGWWHNDNSNIYMTSYVLYGLNKIVETGIVVDEEIILQAAKFLLDKQSSSGKWTSDYWNINDLPFTAFVTRGLSTIANKSLLTDYGTVMSLAHDFIETQWVNSSYVAALTLESFYNTPYSTFLESNLIQHLQNEYVLDPKLGIYWTDLKKGYKALGKDIETTSTALRVLATIDYGTNAILIQEAIQWIVSKQQRWGWYSTADTSAAIQAFISLSEYESKAILGDVDVIINGNNIASIKYLNDTTPEVSTYKLDDFMKDGENFLNIVRQGSGKVLYYLTTEQTLRQEIVVSYPSTLQGKPGSTIQIPVTLTNPSTEILSK